MGNILRTIIVAFIAGIAGAYVFFQYQQRQRQANPSQPEFEVADYKPSESFEPSATSSSTSAGPSDVDFSIAASRVIPSVVYINSISQSGPSYSYWDQLFGGGGGQAQVSSGSGVIFTPDGYIVTNNHVVASAERIQVIYDKKVYEAELIGTDPSTDLGVLKIKEFNLPAITLGSSRELAVGEWVVAVGNPFSLSSTVTAGIVSAKGRRINIVEGKFPIESFIQTDAAINPGNSGGALVNKEGELVGINTAILSKTYTGYAFAVPVDIVKKTVNDLIKFGVVQKAFLGASVIDYDFQTAQKYNLDMPAKSFEGVVLAELDKEGAAKDAGLKLGDIIVKINDQSINSRSAFEEELSFHYPGDKVSVTYLRERKSSTVSMMLVNKNGDTNIIKRQILTDAGLGANLESVEYGVKVFKVRDGLFKRLGIPENYTIISLNRARITDPQDVIDFFSRYRGRVMLYGINSNKQEMPMQFNLQ